MIFILTSQSCNYIMHYNDGNREMTIHNLVIGSKVLYARKYVITGLR